MAIISGGNLMLSDTSPTFARSTYFPPTGVSLTGQFATYAAIYKKQVWVNVVVDKLAQNVARLPLKVYERQDQGDRLEARDTPFAQLLRKPNPKMDPFFFMQWTGSTFFVYGEALWIKVRGAGGQPTELWPLHPVNTKTTEDPDTGGLLYAFYSGVNATVPVMAIPAADIVHFKNYNPDTTQRGLSKLEPLRQTLVNEDAARRATASFWARGARPAAALTYPGKLSDEAKVRLKRRFEQVASGVDNTGSTVVLEEGMDAKIIGLNQEESQYIETRKLNREEVCFVPGTEILTAVGPRPIELLRPGDLVLTHRGRFRPVIQVMERPYDGDVVTVQAKGLAPVRATPNHPFLVQEMRQTRSGVQERSGAPVWQRIGDLSPRRRQNDGVWARGSYAALVVPRLTDGGDHVHAFISNTERRPHIGLVYNLSVAEDESYVTTGGTVHNCAAYDVPPPAVHILDHATYSNVTENLRSVYRDTMAAKLGLFESTIDTELRPDFDADGTIYAEFLLDEVLRGDFETRSAAVAQKIATAQITPNEARKLDNLPAIDGGDRLYINAAYIPIDEVSSRTSPNPPAEDIPGDRPAAPGESVAAPASVPPGAKVFDARVAAKIAWRASRARSLADVDPVVLTAELNGEAALVQTLLAESKAAGDDIPTFCALVWALAGR